MSVRGWEGNRAKCFPKWVGGAETAFGISGWPNQCSWEIARKRCVSINPAWAGRKVKRKRRMSFSCLEKIPRNDRSLCLRLCTPGWQFKKGPPKMPLNSWVTITIKRFHFSQFIQVAFFQNWLFGGTFGCFLQLNCHPLTSHEFCHRFSCSLWVGATCCVEISWNSTKTEPLAALQSWCASPHPTDRDRNPTLSNSNGCAMQSRDARPTLNRI